MRSSAAFSPGNNEKLGTILASQTMSTLDKGSFKAGGGVATGENSQQASILDEMMILGTLVQPPEI